MEVFQTSILNLNLCIIFTLLTQEGLSSSFHQHTNKTALKGENVTLECNNTTHGDDITWKKDYILIFTGNTVNNRTMKNFTSERMLIEKATELKIIHIKASDAGSYSCQNTKALIRWILTVTDRPQPPEQIPLFIISSCTGFIMVCLIISLSIWIHRKQKRNEDAGHRETMEDIDEYSSIAFTLQSGDTKQTSSRKTSSCETILLFGNSATHWANVLPRHEDVKTI